MKKSLARGLKERKQIKSPQHKTQSYKNAKLYQIPQSFLKNFKDLTILDISHNKLQNNHINTIFKTIVKLKTIYINDNLVNIIPSTLYQLKLLVQFRHDWNILFNKNKQQKIDELKIMCKKPQKLVILSSVIGINFITYCETIMCQNIGQNNKQFLNSIKASQCSAFAKEDMINLVRYEQNPNQAIKISYKKTKKVLDCNYACFNNFFLKKDKKDSAQNIQHQQKKSFRNIKISQIKTIENRHLKEQSTQINSTRDSFIQKPDNQRNIHIFKLFSRFDLNVQKSISQADLAFRQGIDPNYCNKNGLTIFHTCVVNNQLQGLKFLFDVNKRNIGFIDLQTGIGKEGKNIFHLSIFLKRFPITKFLIQNGFPTQKRDNLGNRAINLVDQNYQFLYNIKRMLKKNKFNKKQFQRHPSRYQKQSQYIVIQNINQNLITMFDAAFTPQKRNHIQRNKFY